MRVPGSDVIELHNSIAGISRAGFVFHQINVQQTSRRATHHLVLENADTSILTISGRLSSFSNINIDLNFQKS